MRLFRNRSQRMSKCGKNISDTLGYCLVCHFFALITFSCHLWSIAEKCTATRNPFVKLIIITRTTTLQLFHQNEFLRLDDYGGKLSRAALFSLQIKTPSLLFDALKLYLWNSRFWYLVFGTRPFRLSLLTASLRCFGCMGPFSLHCSIVSHAKYQKHWAIKSPGLQQRA